MNKQCLLVFAIIFFIQISECHGAKLTKESFEKRAKNNDRAVVFNSNNLPSISDFELKYRNIKYASDRIKLQYCDLITNTLTVSEVFKKKELIEILTYIAKNKVDLTDTEKCRAFVLGILLSTSKKQELFFAEKLEKINPTNAFVTIIKLKNAILYGNYEEAEELITCFREQGDFSLFVQQGYQNQFRIWTSFFGEKLKSLQSLQMKQHSNFLNNRIWEYTLILWGYDMRIKYPKNNKLLKGTPLVNYHSLDQCFLHQVKMSFNDFEWYADITNMQLAFNYRIYRDSTLYYATGMNRPKENRFSVDGNLDKAKHIWLSDRDALQEIIYEQRKEIFELVKKRMLIFQEIFSMNSNTTKPLLEYLKLSVQGKEMIALDNLKVYESSQSNDLISIRLMPLIEKERLFWESINEISQKETNIEEKPEMNISFD